MKFEREPAKATASLLKNVVAFQAVFAFESDPHVRTLDTRFNYGEMRYKSLGKFSGEWML